MKYPYTYPTFLLYFVDMKFVKKCYIHPLLRLNVLIALPSPKRKHLFHVLLMWSSLAFFIDVDISLVFYRYEICLGGITFNPL